MEDLSLAIISNIKDKTIILYTAEYRKYKEYLLFISIKLKLLQRTY